MTFPICKAADCGVANNGRLLPFEPTKPAPTQEEAKLVHQIRPLAQGSMMLFRTAKRTSSAVVRSLSLCIAEARWVSTVLTLMLRM